MKTKFLIPLAGLALFCACKGKGTAGNDYEVVNNSSATIGGADSAKADSAILSRSKLIKTAALNFEVKNVPQTATRITALTEGFGGIVIHQQVGSSPERSQDVCVSKDSVMRVTSFSTRADITVKVPSVRLQKFMDSVSSMGIYVTKRNLDITDKSLDYLSAQLKFKSRSELVSQQKTGRVVIKDPAKVLYLKDDMIDQQIGNRQIDDAVKNSVVTLNFYQSNTINKEIIASDEPSAYSLPFFKRLGVALGNGCEIFIDVIIDLANIWLFIVIGIGCWLFIKYYKRKALAKG